MRDTRRLAVPVLLALTLAASPAAAQDPDDVRLGAHLALAFAGDANLDVGNVSSSASLDPTIGVGARVEVPVHEYVVIGGLFEVLTFEWDAAGAEREAVFNFDGVLRLRYPIEIERGSLWVEPYVGVPFGLSLAVLDDGGGGDEVWPGFNTGALAGVALILGDVPLAFFGELGWRHHQVFTERSFLGADVDLKVVTNQFAMHFGAAFILE